MALYKKRSWKCLQWVCSVRIKIKVIFSPSTTLTLKHLLLMQKDTSWLEIAYKSDLALNNIVMTKFFSCMWRGYKRDKGTLHIWHNVTTRQQQLCLKFHYFDRFSESVKKCLISTTTHCLTPKGFVDREEKDNVRIPQTSTDPRCGVLNCFGMKTNFTWVLIVNLV